MPHDPARVADTQAWFHRVASDLRCATVTLAADPPMTDQAVYHAQQAAEKSLKGFLTWHDRPFRRTHDLAELGRICVAADPTLQDLCRRAEHLTVYAWTFRYPGEPEEPTVVEARDAPALADEVFRACLERLPPETRP